MRSNPLLDRFRPLLSTSPSTPTCSRAAYDNKRPRIHIRRPSFQHVTPSQTTIIFIARCLAWYTSSALSSNTAKSLLSLTKEQKATTPTARPPFPCPVTLTLLHFLFINLLSAACTSKSLLGDRATTTLVKPSWYRIRQVGQLAIFNVAGQALSSVAISRVPVSTVHTIKALSPLFTVLSYTFLFNVTYSAQTYTSLLPLTLGVMMACTGFAFNADDVVGFSAALGSTFIFVAQNIYSKKLLRKGSGNRNASGEPEHMDKLNILFYSSGCSSALMLPMALYYDAGPLFSHLSTPTSSTSTILQLLLFNGTIHFLQNILALNVLSLVSPVTYSIASLLKRVFVIVLAIVWFHQSVSGLQWAGIFMTFFGLWMYNDSKTREEVEKGENKVKKREADGELGGILPTTMTAQGSAYPRTVANIAPPQTYEYMETKLYIRDPTRSLPSPPYSDKE